MVNADDGVGLMQYLASLVAIVLFKRVSKALAAHTISDYVTFHHNAEFVSRERSCFSRGTTDGTNVCQSPKLVC